MLCTLLDAFSIADSFGFHMFWEYCLVTLTHLLLADTLPTCWRSMYIYTYTHIHIHNEHYVRQSKFNTFFYYNSHFVHVCNEQNFDETQPDWLFESFATITKLLTLYFYWILLTTNELNFVLFSTPTGSSWTLSYCIAEVDQLHVNIVSSR